MTRIYYQKDLAVGESIQLNDEASHHLKVLRSKVGDSITLFNGFGGEYIGFLSHISKQIAKVEINEFKEISRESPLNTILIQGISRSEKMDYTIQKAVELGVKKIIPVFTEFSTVKLDESRKQKKWEHWRAIIIHACEQCGRTYLPELDSLKSLHEVLTEESHMNGFMLSLTAKITLKECNLDVTQPITLLIGPEGGLSLKEEKRAIECHFTPLGLGPRILRTETAALAALSMIQSIYGDMT